MKITAEIVVTDTMEKSHKEKVEECLKNLKTAKICNDGWRIDVENLCNAVLTISDVVGDDLDGFRRKYESDEIQISKMIEMMFQIGSLMRAIHEKFDNDEFVLLEDLIYYYKKAGENL